MVRPKLLMCCPEFYDVDYVINPWMTGNLHGTCKQSAQAQWHTLHAALGSRADVQLVTPQRGVPDMVFTANAGLAFGREVALSRFQFAERSGEETYFRQWFQQAGLNVKEMPHDLPFEGEGDALFSADGEHLWAGYGFRTARESHQCLRNWWGIQVTSLHLVDPRFYHLDTCFAPLPNGDILYFPEAFDAESQQRIAQAYPRDRQIIVAEEDATRFACNVVCMGDTLVLNHISAALKQQLEQRAFNVVELELNQFLKAGGAAKCLVMTLRV